MFCRKLIKKSKEVRTICVSPIMKILTYNINLSSQEKIDKVLGYEADVNILPEVACKEQIKIPEGYRMEWIGDFRHKGLGIIWKSDIKAEVPSWFNPKHQYFLPLLIDGKLIMAAWPTTTEQNRPMKYPQIAMAALQEYAPYIKEYPTVITGDMNCYKGQSGETKQYSIQAILSFLEEMGLVSAYHDRTGEALGCETKATYYHQFKENLLFFLIILFPTSLSYLMNLGNGTEC